MNKCRLSKELSSYLDNQLPDMQRTKIEEHIKICPICSQELARLEVLSSRLKEWHIPSLDSSFDSSVRNEIVAREFERGQVKMKKRAMAILVPSGVLAGILVFIFVGQIYIKRNAQGGLQDSAEKFGGEVELNEMLGFTHMNARVKSAVHQSQSPTGATFRSIGNSAKEELFDYGVMPKGGAEYKSSAARLGPLTAVVNGVVSSAPYATPPGESSVIVIQPVLPATGEGEKIIRTAKIILEVQDGQETYEKASQLCQELGGYLGSSNFYKDKQGRESGTITMRIPKDKFLTAIDKLSALGKLENSSTNSQDVAQEYANFKAQLDATTIVYNKMLEALQKRQTTIPEALRLESELTPVLRQIENLKNRIEYLNNAISFTTITLNFHEPSVSVKVLSQSKSFIKEGILKAMINSVNFIARAIPVTLVTILLLAILFGLAFLVKYWVIRLFRRG